THTHSHIHSHIHKHKHSTHTHTHTHTHTYTHIYIPTLEQQKGHLKADLINQCQISSKATSTGISGRTQNQHQATSRFTPRRHSFLLICQSQIWRAVCAVW